MSFTFTTLKSAIQDYTENTETTFVNDLTTIIKQAEQRILDSVQLPVFRKNQTGTFTSSNSYLATPTDYLYPYSLAVLNSDSEYSFLLNNGLVIYDSRVAASIGYFIKIWYERSGLDSLPKILKIHQMRNPHKRKYEIFSDCNIDKYFTIDSIKTTWIMLKILKDNNNMFFNSNLLNNRMIDFQMALFIMGYDLEEVESSILFK